MTKHEVKFYTVEAIIEVRDEEGLEGGEKVTQESTQDLISRQDAIDEIKALYEWHDTVTEDRAVDHLKRLPSAEPKTGKWIKVIDEETPNVVKWHYECDQCRAGRWEKGQRYCQSCGARMEDGDE